MQEISIKTSWKIAAASAMSLAMTFVDQTALNVALPTIQRGLHMTPNALHWVVNAYLLSLAIFLILGGKCGDRFGKKQIFILGVTVFAIASLLCGMAPNEYVLILSRALQGLGGAFMIPNSSAIIMSVFPDNMRGKVMGTLLSFTSIVLVLGPAIGGVFTQFLSWRYVFWINIPIAVVSIFMMQKFAPIFPANKLHKIDIRGFSLLAAALFCGVYALMAVGNHGWHSFMVITLLGSAIFLFVFLIYHEQHAKHPFLNLQLFQNQVYNRSVFVYSGTQVVFTVNIFLGIYIQTVLGFQPVVSGLMAILSISPVMLLSRFAGNLRDKRGPKFPMLIGLTFLTAGPVWLALTLWTYDIYLIFPGLMCFSAAAPFIFGNANTTALSAVDIKLRGVAAGVITCMRQVGAALGIALLGTIMLTVEHHHSAFSRHYSYMLAVTVACIVVAVFSLLCLWVASGLPDHLQPVSPVAKPAS